MIKEAISTNDGGIWEKNSAVFLKYVEENQEEENVLNDFRQVTNIMEDQLTEIPK